MATRREDPYRASAPLESVAPRVKENSGDDVAFVTEDGLRADGRTVDQFREFCRSTRAETRGGVLMLALGFVRSYGHGRCKPSGWQCVHGNGCHKSAVQCVSGGTAFVHWTVHSSLAPFFFCAAATGHDPPSSAPLRKLARCSARCGTCPLRIGARGAATHPPTRRRSSHWLSR